MKNLAFKRLVVASDTLKSGNQFEFNPRFNLITANDNSFGKSTLAKLLFWTLGGETLTLELELRSKNAQAGRQSLHPARYRE